MLLYGRAVADRYFSRLGPGVQNISLTQLYGVYLVDFTQPDLFHFTTGTGLDGGYAEFVLVNQAQLIPVVRRRLLHLHASQA